MTCSPFDLRDYLFAELPAAEARQVESHLAACTACREELERLRLTGQALTALADEEPPRRIAFVSDKVFEPRWYQRWSWTPALGFASVVLLSVSILVHTFVRPAPVGVAPADLQARVEAEVARRLSAQPVAAPAPAALDQEVARRVQAAVSQVRTEERAETLRLVSAAEQRAEQQRRMDRMSFEENFDYLRKQIGQYRRASLELGGPR